MRMANDKYGTQFHQYENMSKKNTNEMEKNIAPTKLNESVFV